MQAYAAVARLRFNSWRNACSFTVLRAARPRSLMRAEMRDRLDQRRSFLQQELLERRGDGRQSLVAPVDDIPVEHHGKFLHIEHDQAADLTLERDCVR